MSDREQDLTDRLEGEKNPLPENISEYVRKVREELKQYEEQRKFYEKKRKREIVLELVDLLVEYDYPKEWLRLLIARELGDYISTSYIEKIIAEKYHVEYNKGKEQSTCQITEIPLNDDRIPIEVSTSGESTGDSEDDHLGNTISNSYKMDHMSSEEAPTEFKSNLELQAEKGTREIVRSLQKQVSHLQTKCFQLNQLAQERAMWEEKCVHLQQELNSYKNKIIKGNTQIEFGSEFIPVKIVYNSTTNQFSANIPQEVVDRIRGALRRE